ncbi:MAG: hypothetical protein IJZ84_01460 [Lachnospiraceae bacterium]|nr:hypothetical protein [Lachnospiraceae bacterium]
MTIGEMMDRSKAEGLAEGLARGEQIGRKKSLINLVYSMLNDLGQISEELHVRLENADEETLMRWTKLAAKAESLQEFLEQTNI